MSGDSSAARHQTAGRRAGGSADLAIDCVALHGTALNAGVIGGRGESVSREPRATSSVA